MAAMDEDEEEDEDEDAGLARVADGLYAGVPSGFVADRTAASRRARDGGAAGLAKRIAALPKPSAAAALVNRFVREDEAGLARVLDLGEGLRRAQQESDRGRLRVLTAERRDLLARLASAAAVREEAAGRRVSAAVLEEFQQTLQAGLANRDAAAAIRTGRLVRSLAADGLDPVDLTAAVVGGPPAPPDPSATAEAADGAGSAAQDEDRERGAQSQDEDAAASGGRIAREQSDREQARQRPRREAQARVSAAEQAEADARRAATEAAVAARAAAGRAEDRSAAVADLHARIETLRKELADADAALIEADDATTSARRAAREAERTAEDAGDEVAAARSRLHALDRDSSTRGTAAGAKTGAIGPSGRP